MRRHHRWNWNALAVVGLLAPILTLSAGGARGAIQDATPAASPVAVECPPDAAGAPEDGVVRVGVILPLSGTAATVGNDERAALELAVEFVNEDRAEVPLPLAAGAGLPTLDGAQVELVFADSQGQAEVGQSEATRLIEDENVVALFGAYNSAVTRTASTAAERAGIPFLNAESSSPDLTEQGYYWFFRTSPHDGTFSEGIYDFIESLNANQSAGLETVSLLYEDTDFGVNSAAALTEQAGTRGLTIAGEVRHATGASSLTAEVQALQQQAADVLIPSSYTTDAILTVQTARQLGYLPQMIVAQDAGYADPAFVEAVGADAEGIATRSAFSPDIFEVKPVAGQVNELYRAATGKDLYDVPARGLTGMLVLLDAINRACSTDPEAIHQALVDTNLGEADTIMPWTGVTFDDNQQNELGRGIIVQVQGGQYRTVFPPEFAVVEPVVPLAPWDQRP
ncbi:MAG: ABC transporter, substrate-binding protein (cluster 4, leucine/isoleucine/valine/benzoate) [uncultured Thermomicrobiales bacterium]|uniref:ABC transporter, substrate-binding protein (Cluster 4, leucine/isoleucine/valine/benzoate) n=1 Tax=uncultured Thermomicrobiales bacterium TaxID=1645740 RepID=A0A6J4TZ85_9BACT|nr:MAG: ABC transporter, substrate-binding protein (cluster 4, leucine/isoleucine/valine/benzoate) [uncultured Thermomicrobiales bacterium]